MLGISGELRQILINLLQNAIDALPNGGRILIRVQPSRSWRRDATEVPGYAIAICDSGMGIAAAARVRLFTPFFTTKGEQGTGLGLWLVHSLAAKQGGRIACRSRVAGANAGGSGTVFRVWLPLETPQKTEMKVIRAVR